MTPTELELRTLLTEFLGRGRRDKAFVAEIEGLVIEAFQDAPWFDEVSEALALFVPGGGTHYLDEEGLARTLAKLQAALET